MPIILLVLGILALSVLVWFVWMGGSQHLQRQKAQQQEKAAREAVRERLRTAQLRTVNDPREAAAILMLLLAREHGDPTREQIWLIEDKLRGLGVTDDLPERMAQARFVAKQTESFQLAARTFATMLRNRLTDDERRQLVDMLEEVARAGGPSESQNEAIMAFRPMIGLAMGRGWSG
jgi:cytochrome c-type biogenesis protein CcmH/NrfG